MHKKAKLILSIVVFVVLLGAAYFAYHSLANKYKPEQNVNDKQQTNATSAVTKAPDFTVIDKNGNAVKLSAFAGKPIVLNFWASWCGPCKSELPDFNTEYAKFKDKVVFMMINMTDGQRETVASAKQYVKENGFGFPLYFDTSGEAATAYNISFIPMTVLIDKAGNLVKSYNNAIDAKTLTNGIALINQ